MKYLLFFSVALLSSCAQLSSFQTGKTLGKGNNMVSVGAVAYGIQGKSGSIIEGDRILFGQAILMGQFGLTERFDIGLKIVPFGGNAQANFKYQFAGSLESKFAASFGGGFTYQYVNPEDMKNVYRAHLPLYLSYHPGEKSAVYATPRFIYQFVSDDDNSSFYGSSLGYSHRLSKKFTGFLEGSLYVPQTENTTNDGTFLYQIGIGGGWRF